MDVVVVVEGVREPRGGGIAAAEVEARGVGPIE
jgi:hypothetical protein